MQFYPYRTIDEQARRLPLEYREKYKTTALDRIEIDGCEINGYFEYSFMEEKSYMEQPVRSQDGSIENLDDYTTFLTPRLIVKYNMMNIDDYRTLMTFLKSKNSFNVTCYDVVADRRVTHEMYFANPQMPVIYQRYLAAMGVQDYTIELIGTNRRKEEDKIRFYFNNILRTAYKNETFLAYTLRAGGYPEYKVIYSPILSKFIVTPDDGKSAVYYGDSFVSPHDIIVDNRYYGVVSV